MIPEKLNTITTYGQFLFPSSGPHESISEYDILKYEMFMKENDESVKSSDSDNEIDPHHIYSDNPLYTGKRKIPKILNIAKELPKFESTPQPTEKQALLTKIKTKLVNLPINNTYNSDVKPKRKYSIDSMLVLSRLQNKLNINRENDKSLLKRKLFPVCRKLGINEKHSHNNSLNKTLDSKYELMTQNRRILKVHQHKIEFKEQLCISRQRNKYGILNKH